MDMNLNTLEIESVPLKAILTADVVKVSPDVALTHVLSLMQQRSISSVVAVDKADRPVGIFTEQDAIRLISESKAVQALTMKEVMSQPPIIVKSHLGYGDAYQVMSEHKVRHLVVVDDSGVLIGLVSEGDFLHHMGMEYLVELKTVASSMTRKVSTIDHAEPLSVAVSMMRAQKISCVVVTIDDLPAGILTERDMVRLAGVIDVAEQVCVADEMVSPLITISADTPLQHASRLMEHHKVRRLVVMDAGGVLQGMLTRHDIAKSLQGSYIEYLQETLLRKNRDLQSTEARLRDVEQKAFYQNLVEQVSDAIYIIDADDGRILDANLQAAKSLMMPMSDLLNLRVTDISARFTTLDLWLNRHVQELKAKRELLFESGHKRSDGHILPVEVKAKLVSLGNKEYVVAIARDLTERDVAIQKLTESELKFRTLFDESPIPMAYVTFNGDLISVNRQFRETFGYQLDDVPTLNDWFDQAHPDSSYRESASSLWAELVEVARMGDHKIDPYEYFVTCKDGDERIVKASGVTTEDGFLAILEDVTEHKQATAALKASAETYFGVITTALDGFWIVDGQGYLLDVNEAYVQMSGYSRDELVSMQIGDLEALESVHEIKQKIAEIKQVGGRRFLSTHRRKSGERYDVEINVTYWPGGGGRFFVFVRDVTEQKLNEERLRQAAAVFAHTNEGVMITDPDGTIQMVNSAFCHLTGYTESEVIGHSSRILQSGRHGDDFYQQMWQSISENGYWQGEIWNRRKDGSTYPELLSISAVEGEQGKVSHYVGVFADISKMKESEDKLVYLAHHDMLTGLPNRLVLQTRLTQSLAHAKRQNSSIALLLLDLDRFKDVNDSFGHAAGDDLLKQVALLLSDRVRETDLVCRMGGDEFAILLEDLDHPEDAGKVANELIGSLSTSWNLSNRCEVAIGGSIGISIYPNRSEEPEALLQHADAALYRAKAEGRGRFHYFTEELTIDARNRLDMESRLMKAISNGELCVYFQPQVRMDNNQLVGAEALVRWIDPERGVVPPDQFIPLAEQTGLINRIGYYVLKESCEQLKRWLDEGMVPLLVAVNISAVQLRHSDLEEIVAGILEETELPPELLELEITESALMERESEAIELLQNLRNLGVRIALDDFGTGYSSLSYLKKFPLDVLKIDKSFVNDIPHDKDDMVIASTILAMGHNLGLKVLAEGVETEEQLMFLRSKACNFYQGYLTSKPLPPEEFRQFVDQHSVN